MCDFVDFGQTGKKNRKRKTKAASQNPNNYRKSFPDSGLACSVDDVRINGIDYCIPSRIMSLSAPLTPH